MKDRGQPTDAPPVADERVYARQVDLLYQHAPLAIATTLVNGLLLAVVQRHHIAPGTLTLWFALLVLVMAGRGLLAYGYARVRPALPSPRLWGRYYVAAMALSGAVWGSAAVALFPAHTVGHQVFVAFVLAGMTAGAVVLAAPLRQATLCFAAAALLPLAAQFFIQGGELATAMGIMTLLFFAVVMVSAQRVHRLILDTLRLDLSNRDLEARLEMEKQFVAAVVDIADTLMLVL
ncbi:MAG: diguanylate cyclase, partial [Pseudomonadota bacterium]|nr:diguanylate cyclase [Pseudomonadota bacterium]